MENNSTGVTDPHGWAGESIVEGKHEVVKKGRIITSFDTPHGYLRVQLVASFENKIEMVTEINNVPQGYEVTAESLPRAFPPLPGETLKGFYVNYAKVDMDSHLALPEGAEKVTTFWRQYFKQFSQIVSADGKTVLTSNEANASWKPDLPTGPDLRYESSTKGPNLFMNDHPGMQLPLGVKLIDDKYTFKSTPQGAVEKHNQTYINLLRNAAQLFKLKERPIDQEIFKFQTYLMEARNKPLGFLEWGITFQFQIDEHGKLEKEVVFDKMRWHNEIDRPVYYSAFLPTLEPQ